uniref:Uncharacterized protein n=1 Tax=Timema poppense TaxID=170557 RepID=A0A7R9D6W9_TIMPO|nr:unnamed protein product [Timema poppensis]
MLREAEAAVVVVEAAAAEGVEEVVGWTGEAEGAVVTAIAEEVEERRSLIRPNLTPRSPADVDEGVHDAVPYSAAGMARSVIIADALDDHGGAGLRRPAQIQIF